MLQSKSRVYADANLRKPSDYSDYKDVQLEFHTTDNYSLIKRIGRGKYSEVFLGWNDTTNDNVVIKALKPVADMKIKREYKILSNLRGCKNIINILDLVYDSISNTPSFIFEYVETENYKELYATFTDYDIRYYMSQLLEALDVCHSMGVMHRDVKPQNIVIDHKKRKLRLIDWGLADFYHPGEKYNVRVASRYYKGPELLVNYQMYDYSLDIWSAGCTFAGMIFRKDTMFQGKDNNNQLVKITRVLGSQSLEAYLKRYRIVLDPKFHKQLKDLPGIPWNKFVNDHNVNVVSHEALNLLDRMMKFDHNQRISAREALNHQYFSSILLQQKISNII